jgi:hypothetical protein
MIKKYIFTEKIGILTQYTDSKCKKIAIMLVFKETPNFSQLLKNGDYKVDPEVDFMNVFCPNLTD